jgi:hypothetical protein
MRGVDAGFPLREALALLVIWLDASAGEGRSDKDMRHCKRNRACPVPFERDVL